MHTQTERESAVMLGSLRNRLEIRHANWPPKIPSVMMEGA